MKLRSAIAAVAAISVAATTTVTSFAAAAFKGSIDESSGMIACLLSDDGNVPLFTSYEPLSDFVAVELTVKAEDKRAIESAIADGTWVGGAMGFNSQSTGWAQHEWSFQDGAKELTFKATDTRGEYTLSYAQDTPIFAATDTYAQVWAQNWTEGVVNFEIVELKLLNSKGEDIRDAAPVAPAEPTDEAEPTVEPTDEAEPTVEPTDEVVSTEEDGGVVEEADWSAYDEEAMAALNENFKLGETDQIDIYALVGDKWTDLAKVEATFTWTTGLGGWCGGGGIGGGAILSDGSNWLSGPEYGAANANAAVEPDGTATQTIIDITDNPITELASVDAESGETVFGKLFIQNWWNGVEAGAKVTAITAYDADGNVIGEITYDGGTPDNTTTPDKGSADTGVAGVAVAAGVVALAGAAVVAARKRK